MYIENKDYGLRFINLNSCTVYNGNIKYISKSFKLDDEKVGLVFINAKCSISESYNYFKNNTGESMRATKISLPKNNFPKKIKIYYTEENLNSFNRANEEKIKEIIDNSHLLYEMDNNK